ncbi:hypothetical protein T07_9629 [Trichinella nelsoni]|uniref:Uncharacterized protein n=1 Tax=Trichinella nelsoni TaxID=6336 RepID=A0A0V0SB88_9BILA|nr:hypothetical protein T07_9629 [Trichinella nelsoni]
MQIFICPQATPGAMPQAFFLKISNFLKFSPRRRLRLCPRANKNLHIIAGYAQSILMHNLCKFLIACGTRFLTSAIPYMFSNYLPT